MVEFGASVAQTFRKIFKRLGVKGGSETGTIGPPAAIGNAIVDALWHLGVRRIELPFTPHSVWQALRAAGA